MYVFPYIFCHSALCASFKAQEIFDFSVTPLRTDYKPRTAVLTPQVSTEGEKITHDIVRETSVDSVKAKDQKNPRPARVENGVKPISTAELKERVEAHSKLLDAVHEQVCIIKFHLYSPSQLPY